MVSTVHVSTSEESTVHAVQVKYQLYMSVHVKAAIWDDNLHLTNESQLKSMFTSIVLAHQVEMIHAINQSVNV